MRPLPPYGTPPVGGPDDTGMVDAQQVDERRQSARICASDSAPVLNARPEDVLPQAQHDGIALGLPCRDELAALVASNLAQPGMELVRRLAATPMPFPFTFRLQGGELPDC
jgi:hypothetical protein